MHHESKRDCMIFHLIHPEFILLSGEILSGLKYTLKKHVFTVITLIYFSNFTDCCHSRCKDCKYKYLRL